VSDTTSTPEVLINELSKDEQNEKQILDEKVKKNLLWVGIFSIVMLFAGLTSAYIVASGSAFWVDVKHLPNEFLLSTLLIVISSASLFIAIYFLKNARQNLITPLIGFTLLLGISFGFFQYGGFKTLAEQGVRMRAGIINVDGKYGEYYTLYYNNKEISFDGTDYFWEGELIPYQLKKDMNVFCSEVGAAAQDNAQPVKNYGIFMLKYKNEPVFQQNNRFELNNLSLSPTQKLRLVKFTETITLNRGDFYMIGSYGEDFSIIYKGKEIEYKNRKFYQSGQELSAYQLDQLNTSQNQTGSFIIAFVFVHALHWLAGVIVLLVLFINSLKGKYTTANFTGLKIGSIYWHFLGILWLYLYAFLNLIH
jgi:cytochrome c oxidase subunit 3